MEIDRFYKDVWIDFGWILNGCLMDFGRMFGWILVYFEWLFMDFGWVMMDFGWVMMDFGWIQGGFWMGFEQFFDGLWMDV